MQAASEPGPGGNARHPAQVAFGSALPPAAAGPAVDVYLAGTVFLDMVFTGLDGPPLPGSESFSDGLISSPGGVATVAVGLSRLGLRVRLAALFAEDAAGDYLWKTLGELEEIDLSASRRAVGWATPVTISLAYPADRALVTHQLPPPSEAPAGLGLTASTRACFAHIGSQDATSWLGRGRELGAVVFADARWDPTGVWPAEVLGQLGPGDFFLPNAGEAIGYAKATNARAALSRLSRERFTTVVKCGLGGALWVDAKGAIRHEPAAEVTAVDPTGAGDVFDAGFIYGSLLGWPLPQTVRLAVLCSGLSVRRRGSATSAPTLGEIEEYWRLPAARAERDRWHFLKRHLEGPPAHPASRRERPT